MNGKQGAATRRTKSISLRMLLPRRVSQHHHNHLGILLKGVLYENNFLERDDDEDTKNR